jgi:hypothetical protein
VGALGLAGLQGAMVGSDAKEGSGRQAGRQARGHEEIGCRSVEDSEHEMCCNAIRRAWPVQYLCEGAKG